MSDKPRDDFDDDDFDDLDDDTDAEESAAPAARQGPLRRGREAATKGGRAARQDAAMQADGAIHVTDNPSKWFVIGAILVFVAILLNGLILGVGGFATPIPTPTPEVTAAPTAAASATPAASR